ncbi:hypothetical protein A9Q81_10460 [Gammaproteobacteria bacterium 42_54_T18]|nr:hypothetical protein A9Q81_10460 [Gammaproteobacteria bacterium 42_54_T18]
MKFLTAIVLSAALAAPVFANETSSYGATFGTSVVTQPNQRWIFQRVSASTVEDGTRITGRLTAVRRKGLSKGHVDVAAFSPEGRFLAEAAADYSPSMLTRKMKRRGGVHFSVDIPQKLPLNSMIRLSFHETDVGIPSESLHTMNIAC